MKILASALLLIVLLPCGVLPADRLDSPEAVKARDRMVRAQIEARGISQPEVLAALRSVPGIVSFLKTCSRRPTTTTRLPIGEGQTISQPYIVALMTDAIQAKPADRVLEIGTGSGYQAAVLSGLWRRCIRSK